MMMVIFSVLFPVLDHSVVVEDEGQTGHQNVENRNCGHQHNKITKLKPGPPLVVIVSGMGPDRERASPGEAGGR